MNISNIHSEKTYIVDSTDHAISSGNESGIKEIN